MAGWPSLGRVEDRRLAQALRDGDATALAEIYDFYAPRLFDYCHALLRDQDLAADALHDSLIATHQHIGKLREPERFRSWIYAIVRNECLRQLADPDRPEQRHEAPEQSEDAFLDAEERQRLDETRQLVHSALAGMAARHREAVDLSARHDLSAEELAGVLGVSSQQATELVAQARDDLDNSLAAAIIARTGRGDCPSVAALVDEQEWPLPPAVCRKLIRHIESCPTCRDRRKRKVSTNRLMQVLPVASMPSDLRMAVLALAEAPDQHEHRLLLAQRAEPFDVWGWPTSLERRGHQTRRESRPTVSVPQHLWPVLGAAACVLLIVGAIFLITGGGDGSKPANNKAPNDAAAGDQPVRLPLAERQRRALADEEEALPLADADQAHDPAHPPAGTAYADAQADPQADSGHPVGRRLLHERDPGQLHLRDHRPRWDGALEHHERRGCGRLRQRHPVEGRVHAGHRAQAQAVHRIERDGHLLPQRHRADPVRLQHPRLIAAEHHRHPGMPG